MTEAASAALVADDEGTGTPVVLVHGQPGSAASWAPLTGRLAPRHRVLVPDRPGYGRTTLRPGGLAYNASVLAAELVRRRAAPAVVVGHSLGGGIAALLAASTPDVVSALVLVGSVGGPGSVNALDRVLAAPGVGDALAVAGLLAAPPLAGLRRLLAAVPGTGRLADRLVSVLPDDGMVPAGGGISRTARTFAVEQRALVAEEGLLRQALRDVAVPTTVVTGTWDAVVPPGSQTALARAVPGARLVRLPGVGHFVMRDASDALAAIVEDVARCVG